MSNIKPFINNYNWEGRNYPLRIEDWKKVIWQLLPMFCRLKKKVCSSDISKLIKIVKSKNFCHDSEWRKIKLAL